MAKLSDFKPQEKNANKHNEYGLTLLERSIQENGWMGAITTAADGETFAGSARLEKLAELMPDKEPIVIETDGATPVIIKRTDIPNAKDKRAVRAGIADNRVQEVDLEWDTDIMGDMIAEDETIFDGLFNDEELIDFGVMDEPESQDAEPQVDRAAELLEKWQVKTGDLWQIGDHRIICGDCTDVAVVARVMGGEMIDLVLTDPPYSVNYAEKNKALKTIARSNRLTTEIQNDTLSTEETAETVWKPAFKNAFDYARNGAVIYSFSPQGGDQMMMMMMMMMRAEWNKRLHQLIWRKNASTFSMGRLDYQYQHEPIHYTWKGTNHGYYGDVGRSVIDFDRPSKSKLHPTMKPVELIEFLVSNSSKRGEIVFEPFGGSGTCLVAAENLFRRCYAIEISPAYVAVTLQRMADAFEGIEIKRIE